MKKTHLSKGNFKDKKKINNNSYIYSTTLLIILKNNILAGKIPLKEFIPAGNSYRPTHYKTKNPFL